MIYPTEEQINEITDLTDNSYDAIKEYEKLIKQLNSESEIKWPEECVCACKDQNKMWGFYTTTDIFPDDTNWIFNDFGRWFRITDVNLITRLEQITAGKPWHECKVLRNECIIKKPEDK